MVVVINITIVITIFFIENFIIIVVGYYYYCYNRLFWFGYGTKVLDITKTIAIWMTSTISHWLTGGLFIVLHLYIGLGIRFDRLSTTSRIGGWNRYISLRRNYPWWLHQMEMLSALPVLCAGNSPVTGEFPSQMPVTRNSVALFDLRLSKWLIKQSWGWWFETPSRPLWWHHNATTTSLAHRCCA